MLPRRPSPRFLPRWLPAVAALLVVLVGHPQVTQRAEATFKEGHLYTDADTPWQYLQKFCFDDSGGVVSFTFIQDSSVKTSLTQELVLYADQEQSWPSVYGSDMACIDKVRAAKKSYPIQWLDSAPEKAHSYQYEIIGIIPRWWYIAVANCANQRENTTDQGLAIAYWNIHFTNNGGLWTYEFSQDVQGIFQMSCFFLVLYWLMMFVLAWIKNHAKGKNLQYQVVKYVFVAMLIQWVGLLFNLAHYAKYAHDGIGVPELESSFFFFDFTSNLVLLFAVLSICKGWAISTNHLADRRLLLVTIGVLYALYIALYIWSQKIMDPASVLYIYETPPGWTVVAVRLLLMLYSIYCCIQTYHLETVHSKKQFYIVWCVIAASWLLSLPIIVIIAHYIESWKRQRAVFALTQSIQAAMFIVLTYLFRPFRSNRYVDILKPDETRAFGNNNMQVFPAASVEFTGF